MEQIKNVVILVAIFITCFSITSQAALLDRGNGLIYDDILNVTWLKDANYAKTSGYDANYAKTSGYDADGIMSQADARAWTTQLNYQGYDDWRLPKVSPINGSDFSFPVSFDGTTDRGWNITSSQSELSYMFYVNLVNVGEKDTNGNLTGCGSNSSCLTNAGLFDNLISGHYWFGNEMGDGTGWIFRTDIGLQNAFINSGFSFGVWAVRDGDVSTVPVPSALWLFASSLFGLLGWKRKR